jgi:collagen triple helix repeat protein
MPDMKGILDQVRGKDGQEGERGAKGDKGERGEKGPPGKDGKNGKDGRDGQDGQSASIDASAIALEASVMAQEALSPSIPTIDDIEADLPKLGQPIRDSLELLQNDERLDRKAVRGITVSATAPSNPEVGDLWIKT